MNDEQIERLIDCFESLAIGVNKIGDGIKSIAFYIWLPIYLALLALLVGSAILAFVYLV